MKSKTSFFNGTVLLKDITRFCPVWALYLVYGLLWAMSAFASDIAGGVRDILRSMTSFGPLNLIYGFVVAVMLFGDLFKSRLCNGIHALAPRRESWFATHCLAGLLFSLVPNVIFAILITLYIYSEVWFLGLVWLLIMTLQYLFFFGLGVFSVMCSGNRFASAAIYAFVNFGSLIVRWFAVTFYEPQFYGVQISETIFQRLCPVAQILDMDFISIERLVHHQMGYKYGYGSIIGGADFFDGFAERYMLSISILGLVFLALALLLYHRRKLECAGDFMAFRWMRPVFAVVFTLTVGALFEMIGSDMIGQEQVFLWIGILIGYFVGQMLLQRTVAVFKLKTFASCAAVAVALVLSICLAMLDPFGIERWVPEQENVQSVSITYRAPGYYHEKDSCDIPVLLDAVIDVHQAILEEAQITESDRRNLPYTLPSLRISYTMKDGREVIRDYYLRQESQAYQDLQKFLSMPERILGYTDWEEYLSQIDSVSIMGEKFTGEKIRPLMELIRADCEGGYAYKGQVVGTETNYGLHINHKDGSVQNVNVRYFSKNTADWVAANREKDPYPA